MIVLDTGPKGQAMREQAGPEIVIFAGLQDYPADWLLYPKGIQAQEISIETSTGPRLYRWVDAIEKAGE